MNIKEYKKNSANRLGISTAAFYPMETEKAFDIICRKLNFKICEIFVNTKSETETDYLREIKLKAEDNSVRITAVHPYFSGHESFLFFSDYPRRIYDSIDLYRQFFEAAAFWNAEYVIFHGLRKQIQNFSAEKYTENFLLLSDEAKKYGVEVLQENVADTYSSSSDFICEISKIANSVNKKIRFTLDFKHSMVAEEDILKMIDAMGENLMHIHFNDMSLNISENVSRRSCRLPFLGDLDYNSVFQKLFDINYIGDYIIEVYRNSYTTEEDIAESQRKFNIFCENM